MSSALVESKTVFQATLKFLEKRMQVDRGEFNPKVINCSRLGVTHFVQRTLRTDKHAQKEITEAKFQSLS